MGITNQPPDLLPGTLDLLILKTLTRGPMHGYGIATLVYERTGGHLAIEDAALYQALHRLDRQELLDAVARHRIAWHWVKGHSGHPENDRVDALACAEADAQR